MPLGIGSETLDNKRHRLTVAAEDRRPAVGLAVGEEHPAVGAFAKGMGVSLAAAVSPTFLPTLVLLASYVQARQIVGEKGRGFDGLTVGGAVERQELVPRALLNYSPLIHDENQVCVANRG